MTLLQHLWGFAGQSPPSCYEENQLYYMDSMFNLMSGTNALKLVQTYLYLETVRLQGEEAARLFKLRFVPDAP